MARDVTYQEDKSLVRIGMRPASWHHYLAISLLRLIGHTNVAAANRRHRVRPPDQGQDRHGPHSFT